MTGTKELFILIPSAFVLTIASLSASAQPAPQTARQALLEMFFSKTPGTFEKHLPQATRAALRKAGTASGLDAHRLFRHDKPAHCQRAAVADL